MKESVMEQAIDFAEQTGWKVFPLIGKIPPKGFHWRDHSSGDQDKIAAMPWDGADGFGIDCGKSGICVMDIDSPAAGEAVNPPPTTFQLTSKGEHWIYEAPAFHVSVAVGWPVPGADVRGDGGYIKAWNVYEIYGSLMSIEPWPVAWKPEPKKKTRELDHADFHIKYGEGTRNDGLYREGCAIVAQYPTMDPGTLYLTMSGINQLRCVPPLSGQEVRILARQAAQFLKDEDRATEAVAKTRFLMLDEIMAEPSPAYIVDSLIPVGSVGMIFGPSKAGKTFLSIDLAVCLAAGKQFVQFDTVQTPVVLFPLEGISGMKGRLAAARTHHSLDGSPLANLRMAKPISPALFGSDEAITNLIEELVQAGLQGAVCIFDTYAKTFPGMKENDSGPTTEAVDRLQRIATDLGGAVILIHHSKKSNALESRGSGALYAACDWVISANNGKLKVDKAKDSEDGFEIIYKLDQRHTGQYYANGKEITSNVVKYTIPQGSEDLTKMERKTLNELAEFIEKNPRESRNLFHQGGVCLEKDYLKQFKDYKVKSSRRDAIVKIHSLQLIRRSTGEEGMEISIA